ncbi:hypothetical protein ACFKF8_003539, partial [Salmonella enterica]
EVKSQLRMVFWGIRGAKNTVLGHYGAWVGHFVAYELCRFSYDISIQYFDYTKENTCSWAFFSDF